MKYQRILLVHNFYQQQGGEDIVFQNEVKILKERGVQVVPYVRYSAEWNQMNRIKKVCAGLEGLFSLRTYWEIKKLIQANQIQLVHVHNTFPFISHSVYYAARSFHLPVIQTIHNFRLICPGGLLLRNNKICRDCRNFGLFCALKYRCYRNSFFHTLISAMIMKGNRLLKSSRLVSRYILLSEYQKKYLVPFIEENKIVLKPNFTEETFFPMVPANQRSYFIFVGRIEQAKGIHILVKIWKKIEETLLIVGTGKEEAWLKSYIKREKMKNIVLYGSCNNEDLKPVLSYAKAIMIPSLCPETFGMTAIEAFSVGVPVIANQIGALKEIVNSKNGFLIHKNSEKEIVEAVNELADLNVLQKYIEGAYKEYKLKYSPQIHYEKLMEIYESCMVEGEAYE